jgi:hypothetical protein
MKNVPDKCCTENQDIFYCQYFFFENLVVSEIMFRNIVEPERLQTTIRPMYVACCIPKATNTHSDLFSTATIVV